LENRIRLLTHAKETWKQEALELRKEVKECRRQAQQNAEDTINNAKKKLTRSPLA